MKRIPAALFLLFAVMSAMIGCVKKNSYVELKPVHTSFFAMDTIMEISIYEGSSGILGEEALSGAQEKVENIENRLSVTRKDSDIYRLNAGMTIDPDPITKDILKRSLKLCEKTGGCLDISIFPLMKLWGFVSGEYRVPSEDEISAMLENVGYEKLYPYDPEGKVSLPEKTELDLGAVAKGYTADILRDYFLSNGIESAVMSLGGNILVIGSKPDGSSWRIAVSDPSGGGYAGVVNVTDKAVVTSGGYERYFEKDGKHYSHIIDPDTGYPVDNGILSVTVVGSESMYCDALSTALFVMGEARAVDYWKENGDFDFIMVNDERKVLISEGLEGLFSVDDAFGKDALKIIRRN